MMPFDSPSPKFSIITVNKSNATGLAKTLASIANQSLKDFELIVIDGHSTDESSIVIENYSDVIDVCEFDNGLGVYAAMNQGLRHATGQWTLFMNSGDCFFSNSVLNDFSPTVDTQLAYGRAYYENTDTPATYHGLENIWRGQPFCHQALFTKTELLKANPFDECLTIAADYKFLVAAYVSGLTFQDLEQNICRIEAPGLSGKRIFKRLCEKYLIARQAFPEKPLIRLTVRQCLSHYKHLVKKKFYG